MKLIEIEKKSAKKFILKFDDGFNIEIDKKTLINNSIYEHQEYSNNEYAELKLKLETINAEKIIINKLTARKRSEHELRVILKQSKTNETIIDTLIEKYKQLKFIDDYSFTESFINDKLNLNKKPLNIIKIELRKFGISNEIIDELIEKQKVDNYDAELNNCIELINKKCRYKNINLKNFEEKNKIVKYLLNKGYNYEIINQTFTQLNEKGKNGKNGDASIFLPTFPIY